MFTSETTPTAKTTDVPLLGPVAVATNNIPIYGPTEGNGGDVMSLGGGLSDFGTQNSPSGFHMHLFGTSTKTVCMYTPEEAAKAPQLISYAFDGCPIHSGNDHYTSLWELNDESLFATDTWAENFWVAGSGDPGECNGLADSDGNYAYSSTDTLPYVIGCFFSDYELLVPEASRSAPTHLPSATSDRQESLKIEAAGHEL